MPAAAAALLAADGWGSPPPNPLRQPHTPRVVPPPAKAAQKPHAWPMGGCFTAPPAASSRPDPPAAPPSEPVTPNFGKADAQPHPLPGSALQRLAENAREEFKEALAAEDQAREAKDL